MEVKDNFTELFLSFYLYVGPENRTLVSKLVLQGLLSPEPSHQKIRLLEDHSLSSTQQASDLNAAGLFEISFYQKLSLLLVWWHLGMGRTCHLVLEALGCCSCQTQMAVFRDRVALGPGSCPSEPALSAWVVGSPGAPDMVFETLS